MASIQATYRLFRNRLEYKAENYLLDADLPFEVIEKHFTLMSSALLDRQIDHDYGDEEILARHASAKSGVLEVGAMRYRLIVLPPVCNMRSSTVQLLRDYGAQGGVILVTGSMPRLVDGRPSTEAIDLLERCAIRVPHGTDCFDYSGLVEELTQRKARTVLVKTSSGDDVPGIKVQRRTWRGGELVYLANISRETLKAHLTCESSVTGTVEEWHDGSGCTQIIGTCEAGLALDMDLQWAPGQARILMMLDESSSSGHSETRPLIETGRTRPSWEGRRTGPNMLLLDQSRCLLNKEWTDVLSTWQVRDLLRQRELCPQSPMHIDMEYAFEVSTSSPVTSSCELAIELCDKMALTLNGQPVPLTSVGEFLDPAIFRVPLPPCRPGRNVLGVSGELRTPNDVQSPFLLGDFSLSTVDHVLFVMERDKGALEAGSWVSLGLPFYAGSVVYRAEIACDSPAPHTRLMIEMPGLLGSARVRVNGSSVEDILWPPYHCEITRAVKVGTNLIEVEVANTLRNLFGPHYEPDEDRKPGLGSDSYRGNAGEPKRFLDYGLTQPPEMVSYLEFEGRRR